MKKINIAIDGPSGAGKSTIANEIAKKYKYFFVNTGSLYRAIALYMQNKNIDVENEKLVCENWNTNKMQLLIDGSIVLEKKHLEDKELRKDEISKKASTIAKYREIRESVVNILQKFAKEHRGIIMDGRDTTFVVMPEAELKIFLWASPEERALRRQKQNQILGFETNFEILLEEIKARDFQDMNREVNPLHKVDDAILIDSTNMSEEEVIQEISKLIEERI